MFKFNLRDLIWLTVVVALMMVIFIDMFAFRTKKRELNERLIESQMVAEQLRAEVELERKRALVLQKTISEAFKAAEPGEPGSQ